MNSSQQVSDYIFLYPNVMDKKTCEAITTSYEKTAMWHKSTFYDGKKDTGTSQVAMNELWVDNQMPYFEDIKKSFAYCIDDYKSIHETLNYSLTCTNFRLNFYREGGFMNQHIDNIHQSHGQKQGYPHLTSLIFLNDDYEGGEFVLCGDKYIEKIQGSAIVFPSNFMYPHEVKQVISGNRYSIMTWIM